MISLTFFFFTWAYYHKQNFKNYYYSLFDLSLELLLFEQLPLLLHLQPQHQQPAVSFFELTATPFIKKNHHHHPQLS